MNAEQKVHLLSQELIPVIEDVEEEARQVVMEHIQQCEECQNAYTNAKEIEAHYSPMPHADDVEIKPLKKLVQFNRGLKLMLIGIRAVILSYILYTGLQFYDWAVSSKEAIHYMQSLTFIFYFPAVLFLTIFTLVFFSKKWSFFSILFDLVIIFMFDQIITLFV